MVEEGTMMMATCYNAASTIRLEGWGRGGPRGGDPNGGAIARAFLGGGDGRNPSQFAHRVATMPVALELLDLFERRSNPNLHFGLSGSAPLTNRQGGRQRQGGRGPDKIWWGFLGAREGGGHTCT
jgi:hypothetical protein